MAVLRKMSARRSTCTARSVATAERASSDLICWEHRVGQLQRMPHARPLPDPSAQGRIPSGPCIRALMRLAIRCRDWHRKQQHRSSLAAIVPGHRRSYVRPFVPRPFRDQWKSSRIPTAGSTPQLRSTRDLIAVLTRPALCCDRATYVLQTAKGSPACHTKLSRRVHERAV